MKLVNVLLSCLGLMLLAQVNAQMDWLAKALDHDRSSFEIYDLRGPVQKMSVSGENLGDLGIFAQEHHFNQQQRLVFSEIHLGTDSIQILQQMHYTYNRSGQLARFEIANKYDREEANQKAITTYSYDDQGLSGFWHIPFDARYRFENMLPQRYVAERDQLGRLRLLRPSNLLPKPEYYTVQRYHYQAGLLSEAIQETLDSAAFRDETGSLNRQRSLFDNSGQPQYYEQSSFDSGQRISYRYHKGQLQGLIFEDFDGQLVTNSHNYDLIEESHDDYGNWIFRRWQGEEGSISFSREISYFEEQ